MLFLLKPRKYAVDIHQTPVSTCIIGSMSKIDYKSAGVDIDAGNRLVERIKPAVASTRRPEMLGGIGGFGGLMSLPSGYQEPVLVSATDGVGTKLLLAEQIGDHSTIGIDLVAMCVNDILVQGAEPLFFLDYFACGKLDVEHAAVVVEGIAEGCRQAGCALIGGETAEMPGMYADRHYDLAGFSVGVAERSRLIDGNAIQPGDWLLGLPSSGPHSNGYSLIRKVLEKSHISLDSEFTQNDELTLADALLMPTTIYVPHVLPLLENLPIHGMSHITGGGLTENIIRVVPDGLGIEIDLSGWERPGIFNWLQQVGNIEPDDMWRTFNCGIGYVLIVPEHCIDECMSNVSLDVYPIGQVIPAENDKTRVRFLNK